MATLLALVLAIQGGTPLRAAERPPNLVFILTDNQGAWTLGCYGNPDIRTPNIDRLAAEGIRFTGHSRAIRSARRLAPRSSRADPVTARCSQLPGGRAAERPDGSRCVLHDPRVRLVAQGPPRAGYECGLSGKWHLGANLTPQEGFGDWITMPLGHTTEFYDAQVIENGQVRTEPRYLTDLWTEHGVRFIERNKDRPFFLFLAYNGPYGLGTLLKHPGRNRHAAYYADQPLLSFPATRCIRGSSTTRST